MPTVGRPAVTRTFATICEGTSAVVPVRPLSIKGWSRFLLLAVAIEVNLHLLQQRGTSHGDG